MRSLSLRARIFLALVLVYLIGVGWLVYRLSMDLDWRYRESAEEALIETAHLAAALIEQDVRQGVLPVDRVDALFRDLQTRPLSAQVFGLHKTQVHLRAYVTDARGVVLYDSAGQALGQDFSRWRDVRLTLSGQYGARTTRDDPADAGSTVLYVAAPIRWQGQIVGVLTLGKPVRSFAGMLGAARWNMFSGGLMFALALLGAALLLVIWLLRPLGLTRDVLAALAAGWQSDGARRRFSPRRAWRALRAHVRHLAHEVRAALAGRSYVSDYVQQLTHEIKSPLSALRGAAELLQEPDLPLPARQQFAASLMRETLRLQEVTDRMQELSALESRRLLQSQQRVPLAPLLQELAASVQTRAPQQPLALRLPADEPDLAVEGDAFLLHRAVGNLLDNALGFSPAGACIDLAVARQGRLAVITVRDRGPGLPAYARQRVFEKFFSLPRPGAQSKSTGLGLSFVREIALLHQGSVSLENAPGGGALATLALPALPPGG